MPTTQVPDYQQYPINLHSFHEYFLPERLLRNEIHYCVILKADATQ